MSDYTITVTPGTVQAIQGVAVSTTAPITNQVLEFDGSNWVPTNLPSSLPPSGTAGGDLGGSYPSPMVINIQGISVPIPSGTNSVLTYNSGAYSWNTISGGITALTGDVIASGSGSVATTIAAISGSTPITIAPSELQWTSGTSSPKLDQASTSSSSGQNLTVQAQGATGAGNNGGNLILSSGSSGSAIPGKVNIQAGGITIFTVGNGGVQYNASTNISLAIGTVTLTESQYKYSYLVFTGSLSGNVTVIFPSIVGARWILDYTNVTFNSFTITPQANGVNVNTAIQNTQSMREVTYGGVGRLYSGSMLI